MGGDGVYERRRGALFATPPSGKPLGTATSTLEAQYALSLDFRESLIEFENQTSEWERMVDSDSAMADNSQQSELRIQGDRDNDITHLTVTKNDVVATIIMGSTWTLQ
eukprot:824193_1